MVPTLIVIGLRSDCGSQMERGLFRQLSALQAQAHTGGSSSISPGDVRAIADDASRVLSPTHWIVALAYILLQVGR